MNADGSVRDRLVLYHELKKSGCFQVFETRFEKPHTVSFASVLFCRWLGSYESRTSILRVACEAHVIDHVSGLQVSFEYPG